MACERESEMIGEHEYTCIQWPAETALRFKFRIGKILGSGLEGVNFEDPNGTMQALGNILANAEPDVLVELMRDVACSTFRDGSQIKAPHFNEYFSGSDLPILYKVFFFVLRVNYKDFFKGQVLEGLLAKAEAKLSID